MVIYDFASLYTAHAHVIPVIDLIWYLYSVVPSFLHFRILTSEILKKFTHVPVIDKLA